MQSEEQRGDAAYQRRESAKRRRQWTIQLVVLVVLVAFVWLLVHNVSSNLAERSIRSGFDFLKGAANFEIGEVLLPFDSSQPVWLAFLNGVLNTIRVAVFAIITSMVLGAVVGIMRLSNHPILRFLGTAHVEVYRNIPLIIQLFAVYMLITELLPASTEPLHAGSWALLSKAGLQFAVPAQTGLAAMAAFIAGVLTALLVREIQRRRVTDLVAGLLGFVAGILVALVVWVIFGFYSGWSKPVVSGFMIEGGAALSPEFLALWLGLTFFTSAAIAEIVRAGVLAVKQGQWNAGLALGLTRSQVVSYIVFPQSMRLAIPPLTSQFMNLTKNSSLAVVIGYPDIVAVGNSSINITGQALEVIVIIMAVYLFLNLIISVLMNALNTRVMRAPRHPYTKGLMAAIPRLTDASHKLTSIPGNIPNMISPPEGCRFSPRGAYATEECRRVQPETIECEDNHQVACHAVAEGRI